MSMRKMQHIALGSLASFAVAWLAMSIWSPARGTVASDFDSFDDAINGYWWGGNSAINLDLVGGTYWAAGSSYTGRASAVQYGWVRSVGTESCGIIETDTNWDDEDWSTSDLTLFASGSGSSSAGSCSWNPWSTCKAFSTDGSHRVDLYGFGYETRSTDAWVLEPFGC